MHSSWIFMLVGAIVLLSCKGDTTAPPDQDQILAPEFGVAEDHQAVLYLHMGNTPSRCGVWSPNGYWVNVECTHIALDTQGEHGSIISMSHFTVSNDSRKTVTYSNENPPVPGAICYDGALQMYLPNWKEHVSASGEGYLRCWAP